MAFEQQRKMKTSSQTIKTKKVLRYYTPCGRGFWKKQTAIHHENICKCWKNPKYKTCKSCANHYVNYDPDDYPTGYRGEGYTNQCRADVNPDGPLWNKMDNFDNIDINIYCSKWE